MKRIFLSLILTAATLPWATATLHGRAEKQDWMRNS